MIQVFKYFWLSLLISILCVSVSPAHTASREMPSKVKRFKKTAKMSRKNSQKKKKGKKKVSAAQNVVLDASMMGELPPPSLQESEESTPEAQSSEERAPVLNPLSETEAQISTGDAILKEEMVAPVTEKTPEEALESPSSTAQNSAPQEDFLTLAQALEGAYAQSPLLTAEYQVKAAQMALSGAKREWLPKTGASVGYTHTSGDYVSSRGLSSTGGRLDSNHNINSETTQGGLSLQQNLYSGGSTSANILAQQKGLDAAVAAYSGTLRDTLYTAIQAFIELSKKQEIFRLSKANQALLERQLEVAQNRYEFGELTRYDVAATQAKLDKAKADVITALAEVEIAKATFIKITGITSGKTLKKPEEPSALLPESKAKAIEIALKFSPDLHQKDALAAAAQAETDKTFGGLLPSFDINATASRRLTDNYDASQYYLAHGKTRREELEAGATLSIPLDFRGLTQSSIRQQKYVAAQKRLTAIYERRTVMEAVSKYWDSLEAARARIAQIKSQVNAAKIAVEVVTEEFLAGNKTTLDVLTAEQELFTSQVDLINAEQAVILNAYQLLATMGSLTVENLSLNVSAYNPDAEYKEMSFWGVNIKDDERIKAQEISTNIMKNAEETK
jgi:outer membrane protein